MKTILFTTMLAVLLLLFSYHADAQPLKLYLAGTLFNPDLSLSPPHNGSVSEYQAINAYYPVTFDHFFLTEDIVGTSYTFAIRCRTNGAGGRIFNAKIQVGGQEVASKSWTVSSPTMTLYTNTVTGIDPTITTSTEVKLIVTIDGTLGATSAISLGDSSQSNPLYSYIEIPPMISTGVEELRQIAASFALEQNYPNPFNPTTTITYGLPVYSHVKIEIFDFLGRIVSSIAQGYQSAGRHEATFDAGSLSSGTYFYRLEAVSASDPGKVFTQVKKMILMK